MIADCMEYLRSHDGKMGDDFLLATAGRTPGSLVVAGMTCLRGLPSMALYMTTPSVCSLELLQVGRWRS